jgi:hypothetical protein
MTTKRIIYPNGSGGVAVLTPVLNNAINDQTGQWIPLRNIQEQLPQGFRLCTVEDVASKDVPDGSPYEIIEAADLPDRASRNAWEWA